MSLDQRKYEHKHEAILRDVRPLGMRVSDGLQKSSNSTVIFCCAAASIYINDWMLTFADLIMVFMFLYFLWLISRDRALAFKLPLESKHKDSNNGRGGKKGEAEGILYLGNVEKTNEEVWFTNSDIRTHILYLGTTGAGKTEGLKSLVTNCMTWGSGFVYVDGKADTDLWSSLSSLVRRFGRDDDLLVLNYMTGNADVQAPSNTMNPFSSGSASYLTNMLVSLMPESGGDNAMWKERAVSLVGAMMPALTWKRDNQEVPLSVRTIRDYLSLNNVIKLARDDAIPSEVREGMTGYLDTLPGFIHEAYDDEGKVKPPGPDTPQYNTETASQQHGYLAMQFTRSLQSLGDDYGYIFDTQAADVDMVDVVLNRRILVVLVPALEKSGDEVANLGKIVAASIKGMMGSTLGSTVEGDSASVIENKPTHSSTPFMTVFDEVGYYVAEGMAVMAAQARSLGFSLVFAGQDLPAMKKRVREEANSITANCNIKLFGKLEDPTETKEFFEKTVGSAMVTEVSGFQMSGGGELGAYHDTRQAGVQLRPRASYDALRGFKEGQAVITYGETVVDCAVFYSNPGFAKAMRVTRFMTLPPPDEILIKHSNAITKLRDLMVNKTWTAQRADVAVETSDEIAALNEGFVTNNREGVNPVDAGIASLVMIHALSGEIPPPTEAAKTIGTQQPTTPPAQQPATPPPTQATPSTPTAQPVEKPAEQQAPLKAQKASDIAENGDKAKPAIFGGAPKKAEEKPATTTTTAAAATTATVAATTATAAATTKEEPIKKAAEDVKDALFTDTAKSGTPATTTPAETSNAEAPAKPSIFGGAPKKAEETPAAPAAPATPPAEQPAQTATPTEQPSTPTETSNAEAPVKPAIFGGAPKKAEETPATPTVPPEQPAQTQAAPTEQKAQEPTTTTPPPTTEQSSLNKEEPLKSAAEGVKESLFGAGSAPIEKPSTETAQSTPAETAPETETSKPAIFGSTPAQTEKPAEETSAAQETPQNDTAPTEPKQEEQPKAEENRDPEAPKKPAIFGKKPDDSDKKDDN